VDYCFARTDHGIAATRKVLSEDSTDEEGATMSTIVAVRHWRDVGNIDDVLWKEAGCTTELALLRGIRTARDVPTPLACRKIMISRMARCSAHPVAMPSAYRLAASHLST
jgi:hypothetical protein